MVGSRSANSPYNIFSGAAIYLDADSSGAGEMTNLKIHANYVFGPGPGIVIQGELGGDLDGADIYNNIVNTEGNCFKLSDYVGPAGTTPGNREDVRVYNNTFVHTANQNANEAVVAVTDSNLNRIDGFEFRSNIVARTFTSNNAIFTINTGVFDTHPNMTISHNLQWSSGGNHAVQGTAVVEDDPVFEASSFTIAGKQINCPFYLNPNSAALNNGYYPVFPFDIRGVQRHTATDLGVFEN